VLEMAAQDSAVLAKFEIKRSSCKQKFRGASKRWRLGEIKNIVAPQKKGIVVKTKISSY